MAGEDPLFPRFQARFGQPLQAQRDGDRYQGGGQEAAYADARHSRCDPELAPATEPQGRNSARRQLSITGIWESGRGDLAERHDEIIRGRLKRPA